VNTFQVLREVVFPPEAVSMTLAGRNRAGELPVTMHAVLMAFQVARVAELFSFARWEEAFEGPAVAVCVGPWSVSVFGFGRCGKGEPA
jgi:hypothetical protein